MITIQTVQTQLLGEHSKLPDLDIAELVEDGRKRRQDKKFFTCIEHCGDRYFFKLEVGRLTVDRWLRKSLARCSLECFEALCAAAPSFRTPAQYAIWERSRLGFPLEWAILTEYVPDAVSIHDFLQTVPEHAVFQSIMRQFGENLGRLHGAGFASFGVDETNILIQPVSIGVTLWFIDLEHSKPLRKHPHLRRNDVMCAVMLLGHACACDSRDWPEIFFSAYNRATSTVLSEEAIADLLNDAARQFQGKWGRPMGYLYHPHNAS
jgi:hypothetical protein